MENLNIQVFYEMKFEIILFVHQIEIDWLVYFLHFIYWCFNSDFFFSKSTTNIQEKFPIHPMHCVELGN